MCTIVTMSTTEPLTIRDHHLAIEFHPTLPAPYNKPRMWVKGDIVLTVAFHRLRYLFNGKNAAGDRNYDIRRLDPLTFEKVRECVRFGLGL